jgi:hypothetical protein
VFIVADGDEFLHFREIGPKFTRFEEFVESLIFDIQDNIACYVGIVSKHNYDMTMQQLAKYLGLNLKLHVDDDPNGHYDFAHWHSAYVPLELDDQAIALYAKENATTVEEIQEWTLSEGATRNIYSIFSPYQHRSGTYLCQDNPEVTVVLEIHKSWFPIQKPIDGFIARLLQMPDIIGIVKLP